jgi:type IV pilus assembly protein PilN
MIRINLLPYIEKKKKETRTSQLIIVGASFALFFILIAAIIFYMTMSISSLEAEIKNSESRLATLTKIIGEIEIVKADKQIIEKKLEIIKSLEENRLYPVQMLDQFASIVPSKDIWLDKITETGTDLRIEGMGRDSIAVARFMKILEMASFIKSVDLIASKEKEIAGVKLQQFTLKCATKRKI